MANTRRLGILAGGGPAPGINSVISSATIAAVNRGWDVVGILDGYEFLMAGRTDMVRPLRIQDVTRLHSQGGSILGISRANPTVNPEDLQRTVDTLHKLDISAMVSIGGDDTLWSSSQVVVASHGTLRMAHVPKTIDNDLPLPGGMPTFGFETARHYGTQQVLNLMEEARTTGRWFFVVVMGRAAGHLALGIGKSASATVTIIPEEFAEDRVSLDAVANVLAGAMLKRLSRGQKHGVAVIAEGILEKLHPEELKDIPGTDIAFDPHGHMRLDEVPLGPLLRRRVTAKQAGWKESVRITDVSLGYTLRSAPPIPFDIDYTQTLGHGAIGFLNAPSSDPALKDGGMVCLEAGHVRIMSMAELRDPAGGKVHTRRVDITSEHYKVARDYMIRLVPKDLEDKETLEGLSQAAGVSPVEFVRTYGGVVGVPVAP